MPSLVGSEMCIRDRINYLHLYSHQLLAIDDELNLVNEVQELLPQGTTSRPSPSGALRPTQGPQLPSLADLPTSTFRPPQQHTVKPFGSSSNTVPGTTLGKLRFDSDFLFFYSIRLCDGTLKNKNFTKLNFQNVAATRFLKPASWVGISRTRANIPGWWPSTCMETGSGSSGVAGH